MMCSTIIFIDMFGVHGQGNSYMNNDQTPILSNNTKMQCCVQCQIQFKESEEHIRSVKQAERSDEYL